MKLICDECGAKYSIADEKVRGKVFKIRCKKCQNVIVVRGTDQPTAEGGQTVSQAEGAAPAPAVTPSPSEPEPIWYVVIGRDQVGPLTDADIEERVQRGEVTGESFVWQEGFSDWVPISTVDRFTATVQAMAPAPSLTPEPAPPAPEPAVGGLSGPTVAFGSEPIADLGGGDDVAGGAAPFGLGEVEDDEATSIVPGGPELAQAIAAEAAAAEAAAQAPVAGEAPLGMLGMDEAPAAADPVDSALPAASAEVGPTTEQAPVAGDMPFSAPPEGGAAYGGVAGEEQPKGDEVYASGGAAPSQHDGMFAGFEGDAGADGPLEEPGAVPDGMVGARKDNSVLFSLKNLQSLAMGEAEAAAPSTSEQTDASGLIDVRSLASDVAGGPPMGDLADGDEPPMAPAPAAPMMIPMVRRRSNTPIIIAALIAGAIVLTGGILGAIWILKGPDDAGDKAKAGQADSALLAAKSKADKGDEKAVEPGDDKAAEDEAAAGKKKSKRKAKKRDKPKKVAAKSIEDKFDEVTAPKKVGRASSRPARSERRKAPVRKPPPKPKVGGDQDLDDLLGGTSTKRSTSRPKPPPRRAERPKPKPGPTRATAGGDKKLSKSQVQGVVRKNKGKIKVCAKRDPSATGTLTISFQIETNGRVRKASVKSPERFKRSPAGRCVVQAVKTFKFPSFSGKPVKINYPFKL